MTMFKIKSLKRRIMVTNVLILLVVIAVVIYDICSGYKVINILKNGIQLAVLALLFGNWLMTGWYIKLHDLKILYRQELDEMYLLDFDEEVC